MKSRKIKAIDLPLGTRFQVLGEEWNGVITCLLGEKHYLKRVGNELMSIVKIDKDCEFLGYIVEDIYENNR